MEFKFVSSTDLNQLNKILEKLKAKYKNHSNLQKNFYRALPDNNEKPFAIACLNENIKIIYQVVRELKFTRGMQPVYHTQQLLNEANEKDLNEFQKWMVQNLEGYKVVALNSSSNDVFHPHQVYMEAKNRPTL